MKKHLIFSILVLGLIFPLLTAATSPTLPIDCEARLAIKPELPLTLPFLSTTAREDIKVSRVMQPQINFFDLDGEMRITRQGVNGPKALQDMIGTHLKFMSVPSANSPTDITVGSPEVGITIPLRIETTWQGAPAGTLAFFSLPYKVVPETFEFIVGPQYEYLDIQLHGGGTQHARGENSTSLGIPLGKRGVPVMGLDLPGHGDGPTGDILTMEQICDWLMDIINKTVHPDVKITLSGHSWGAMIAVYLRNHSDNPKYARIRNAIAISPGVDVSLGGDVTKKLEFDRWFEQHYDEREKDIAPGDFEFRKTSVENDKLSIRGAYATVASNMDYTTPVLTPEQQQKLIPLSVFTGIADGLTYVGYEEPYHQAFGNLIEGSGLYLLGPGTTFKSKDETDFIMTGHQVFDLYIPGTTIPLVYKSMGDLILNNQSSARPAPGSDKKPKELSDIEKKQRVNQNILDEVLRQYAHFFPFRKLVENFVRYKRVPTPHLKEVSDRKKAFDDFANKVTSITNKNNQERAKALQTRAAELRAEVGLTERLDFSRAQEELAYVPLTEERKAALVAFIEKASQIEDELKAAGDDDQYKEDVQELWEKHSEFLFLQGIQELADYRALLSKYEALSKTDLTPEKKKIRTQLATIDQEYKLLETAKSTRFGQERLRRIKEFGAPNGLTDAKAANRELLADRSEARRAKVQLYVDQYPAAAQIIEDQYNKLAQEEINKLAKPDGVSTFDEARQASMNQEALLGMMYGIPGQPEVQALALEIEKTMAEKEAVQKGTNTNVTLDKLEQTLRDLKAEREKQIKRWDNLVKEKGFTSAQIDLQREAYSKDLEVLKKTHNEMSFGIDEYLQAQFLTHNTVTKQMIIDRPQSLRDLENSFMNARLKFLNTHRLLNGLYMSEALAGNVHGETAFEAMQIAQDLSAQNPMSITSRMHILDQHVEQLREQESLLAQRKERLHWQYAQLMKQKGIPAPYDIERIEIYKLLDQPLADLLTRMEQDPAIVNALQDLLNAWKPLAKKLRNENQLSD